MTTNAVPPIVLAIDTSCDETSVAVTQGQTILSNVVASQVELHRPYGGVFPTVAKLAHQEHVAPAIALALKRAHLTPAELDGVVVTVEPGLAPALEVGIKAAQDFASLHQLPLIPANHLEGHILSVLAQPRHTEGKSGIADSEIAQEKTSADKLSKPNLAPKLPSLAIIVSGGNTLFVSVATLSGDTLPQPVRHQAPPASHDHSPLTASPLQRQPHLQLDTPFDQTSWQPKFVYTILGRTLDDAAGECLDKVGRMLNLGYPAGPVIEQFARLGDPKRYPFPLPLTQTKTFDLSYSGIKTHSRNLLTDLGGIDALNKQDIYDFCASLQHAVFRHLTYKLEKILVADLQTTTPFREVWLSGGVAANKALRTTLRQTLKNHAAQNQLTTLRLRTPYTKKLCGDNAAMIGLCIHTISSTSMQG